MVIWRTCLANPCNPVCLKLNENVTTRFILTSYAHLLILRQNMWEKVRTLSRGVNPCSAQLKFYTVNDYTVSCDER